MGQAGVTEEDSIMGHGQVTWKAEERSAGK